MRRRPPRSTRTDTPCPCTTLFRSRRASGYSGGVVDRKDQNGPFPASVELTHLDRLEAESIHIMREVMADAAHPVMLYSVGKDSAVMLHLARKAFYPSPRSEERSVGKECVRTCRSRWAPSP